MVLGHVGVPRRLLGDGLAVASELPAARNRADAGAAARRRWRPARLGVLGVAATTATAGIIVGVVTLTGLGLKIAGIIVALAGGQLFLTVVYSAIAVWLLGLAVPVTASYIIAAVMVAPALMQSACPTSPRTCSSSTTRCSRRSARRPRCRRSPPPPSPAAIPFETMMLTWKYTLPAFLVPFVFTLSPEGLGALCRPAGHDRRRPL